MLLGMISRNRITDLRSLVYLHDLGLLLGPLLSSARRFVCVCEPLAACWHRFDRFGKVPDWHSLARMRMHAREKSLANFPWNCPNSDYPTSANGPFRCRRTRGSTLRRFSGSQCWRMCRGPDTPLRKSKMPHRNHSMHGACSACDMVKAMAGTIPWTQVREICGRCGERVHAPIDQGKEFASDVELLKALAAQ
jgi:hypothetical protein